MRSGWSVKPAWRSLLRHIGTVSVLCGIALGAGPAGAQAQTPSPPPAQAGAPPPAQAGAANAGPIQPWGLPPLPAGVGPVEKFADIGDTPQGKFLEGGAFDTDGNLWFVAIATGWISFLTPEGKLVLVVSNTGNFETKFVIRYHGWELPASLPSESVGTWVW